MMFWLQEHGAPAAQDAAHAAGAAAGHGGGTPEHHTPVIVEWVNRAIGEPLYHLQLQTTKKWWDQFFHLFGSDAEKVLGHYSPETAVPWYTVMFVIACLISVGVVLLLRRGLSEDDPSNGQQVLEAGILSIRNLLTDVIGPHGMKYFPVVATFAVLILISNLMAFIPGLLPPTASVNVTFALGITSFVYYNYIGIRENGLFGHLRHLMGPVLAIAPLMFLIELISNLVRPMSLGIRLFGNIFADEQVVMNISNLYKPFTQFIIPVLLMPLGLFVALIQTFVFVFLSIVYISEVSHAPHDEHERGHDTHQEEEKPVTSPVPV